MDESNADEIFALVVDAYQNPIRYKDWWSTRVDLPLGCGVLLRIANGDLEQADHYCHTANVSKGDLQEAAVFFVKQAFFCQGGNHYRALGLNLQSTQEQIKDNYRLLMRLFHPDKQHTQGTWTDVYAGRVNQAYNILRKPELRNEYDATLNAIHFEFPLSYNEAVNTRSYRPHNVSRSKNSKPIKFQFLAYLVFASIIFLAALFLARSYFRNNYQVVMVESQDPISPATITVDKTSPKKLSTTDIDISRTPESLHSKPKSVSTVSPDQGHQPSSIVSDTAQQTANPPQDVSIFDYGRISKNVAPSKPASASVASEPPPQSSPPVSPKKSVTTISPPRTSPEIPNRTRQTASATIKPVSTPDIRTPPSSVSQVAKALPPAPAPKTPAPIHLEAKGPSLVSRPDHSRTIVLQSEPDNGPADNLRKNSTVSEVSKSSFQRRDFDRLDKSVETESRLKTQPTALTKQPDFSERELSLLLGRFVNAYERGDLGSFMALFSDQASASGKQGKANIRKEYAKLFNNTHNRRIDLNNIVWRRMGDTFRGSGRFFIQTYPSGERNPQKFSGKVSFIIEKQNGRLFIRGFYHIDDG